MWLEILLFAIWYIAWKLQAPKDDNDEELMLLRQLAIRSTTNKNDNSNCKGKICMLKVKLL